MVKNPRPRAFTLLELMLALFTLSLVSVAVCTLTFGAMNTDRYLRSANTGQSELELATRRIANNIREAQTGTITVGPGTLTTTTQADLGNGFPAGAVVIYALQADPDQPGRQMLVETDQRYGANPLAHNITTFTVTPDPAIANLYQVDIVLGASVVNERHFKVFARN